MSDNNIVLISDLEKLARQIKVKDEFDFETMEQARELRLQIKNQRLSSIKTIEESIKELKAQIEPINLQLATHRQEIKDIEAVAKPIEALLLEQEEFADRARERKLDERLESRLNTIREKDLSTTITRESLREMDDDTFNVLIKGIEDEMRQREMNLKIERRKVEVAGLSFDIDVDEVITLPDATYMMMLNQARVKKEKEKILAPVQNLIKEDTTHMSLDEVKDVVQNKLPQSPEDIKKSKLKKLGFDPNTDIIVGNKLYRQYAEL
jgi:hypothetical protein